MVSRWLRPLAAVAAAGALLVAVPVAVAGRAASAPRLQPLPADRLVASVAAALAAEPSLQGELAARVDLGLPSLAGVPGASGDQFASFFGDHRLRLWSSPDGHRLADLLPAAERSLVAGRDGAWAWDSSSFTAWRLADGPAVRAVDALDPSRLLGLVDPLALARRSLAALDPSTAVSVAAGARVAGRPAYVLRLVPRTRETLVGRVEVAVDAARRVPLRVAVYARGAAKPAVQAAFTRVRFGPVDPATFSFRPPPGATIRRPGLPKEPPGRAPEYLPRTFGSGWATVVALPLPGSARPSPELTALLPFSGPLFSARLAVRGEDRWLLYGAVPQAALVAAEAKLPS